MALVRKIPMKNYYNPNNNSSNAYVKELKENRDKAKLSESIDLKIQNQRFYQTNKVASEINNRREMKLIEDVQIKYAEKRFLDELTKVFIDSLNVDDDFIQEHAIGMKEYFRNELINLAEGKLYNFMDCIENNSNYLTTLVEACKKSGKKAAKKVKEKLVNKKDIKSESEIITDIFEDDDCDDCDDICLDSKEVSDVVKEKVLNVVKDEEEANEKKKQIIEELNNSDALGESIKLFKNDVAEKYSLFHSMMIKNHKQCLNALHEGKNIGEYGSLNEDGEAKINMDYVLLDSIMEYTTLEVFNTTRMKSYSTKELKEMAYNLAYM